jgi:hypothetical protein
MILYTLIVFKIFNFNVHFEVKGKISRGTWERDKDNGKRWRCWKGFWKVIVEVLRGVRWLGLEEVVIMWSYIQIELCLRRRQLKILKVVVITWMVLNWIGLAHSKVKWCYFLDIYIYIYIILFFSTSYSWTNFQYFLHQFSSHFQKKN